MKNELNTKKLIAWLAEQVEKFKKGTISCSEFDLNEDYAIYIGWLSGFDDFEGFEGFEDEKAILNQGYGLNAGIKKKSKSHLTDYEDLEYPVLSNGQKLNFDYLIDEDENYEFLSDALEGDWDILCSDLTKTSVAHLI